MTTDNRTNHFTDEQVIAAAMVIDRNAFRVGEAESNAWETGRDFPSELSAAKQRIRTRKYRAKKKARAALVAAAGAAPQAGNEPMYSLVSRQWSGSCPCVRAEQVDPECEWHGRPEFRIGGEFHHDSPGVEIVTKAARVLHVATCCKLSAGSKHQEPQNEDMFTAGVVLNSVPLAAPVQPSSTVDEAALIREAKAEAWDRNSEETEFGGVCSCCGIGEIHRPDNPYREGSET